MAVCVVIIVYLALGDVPSFFGLVATAAILDAFPILISIGLIATLAIGGWIGYTMVTTPPKPIVFFQEKPPLEKMLFGFLSLLF